MKTEGEDAAQRTVGNGEGCMRRQRSEKQRLRERDKNSSAEKEQMQKKKEEYERENSVQREGGERWKLVHGM